MFDLPMRARIETQEDVMSCTIVNVIYDKDGIVPAILITDERIMINWAHVIYIKPIIDK